jgi:hypothetical protein
LLNGIIHSHIELLGKTIVASNGLGFFKMKTPKKEEAKHDN